MNSLCVGIVGEATLGAAGRLEAERLLKVLLEKVGTDYPDRDLELFEGQGSAGIAAVVTERLEGFQSNGPLSLPDLLRKCPVIIRVGGNAELRRALVRLMAGVNDNSLRVLYEIELNSKELR